MTTPAPLPDAAGLVAADPSLNPALKSWVESANDPATDFPIQNLPLGVCLRQDDTHGDGPRAAACVAIGDSLLDIDMLFHAGAITAADEAEEELLHDVHHALHAARLNLLAMSGLEPLALLRRKLQEFLAWGDPGGQSARRLRRKALVPLKDARLIEPLAVGNYTDFYASIHHATNVGSMFRPDNPLLPNYKHVPIGYHGRASSIVASGRAVRRPSGQTLPDGASEPVFGPCKRLDYELEVGVWIGGVNELGTPEPLDTAERRMFGLCLVNDWSARDVQAWEYQPLGPFLAKNFATSVSPWVVTTAALAPFRVPGPARGSDDPCPLQYLRYANGQDSGAGFDIHLEVLIASAKMRAAGTPPMRVSLGNLRDMYWTFGQMLAHHTSNGCNLRPGDLIASGTVSGPAPESRGCLLERTWAGNGPDKKPLPRTPLVLPTGEKRIFLEDGDEVLMRGWCERAGFRRIGFGECRGIIEPARV